MKIISLLKSCLVDFSHFEIIKANTEAFLGKDEDNDDKPDNVENEDDSASTDKDNEDEEE